MNCSRCAPERANEPVPSRPAPLPLVGAELLLKWPGIFRNSIIYLKVTAGGSFFLANF